MQNFRKILEEYDFNINKNATKRELHQKFKRLNRYINFSATLKKNEMINIIDKLSNYTKYYNYTEFLLGNKVIKPTAEQTSIIMAPTDKHTRIIACAGSGKTTTILFRIKYLIDNYTTPDKILVLTFNVEAYLNLKRKITELFGFEPKIEIRTIDSYSAKLYHLYCHELGNMGIKNIIVSEYSAIAQKILKKYGNIICNQYKYLFFDEFQDINDIQFNIIKSFGDNKCNLTIIGDDNQNIYQWRGTNNMYLINFDNMYKNTNTYTLSTNYRSNKSIIDLANTSINYNINRIDKKMIPVDKTENEPQLLLLKKKKKDLQKNFK